MKKKRQVLMVLTGCLLLAVQARAQFAGGTGTEVNPYQVATATQLNQVRNYLSFHFIQTADIDLGGDDSGGDFYNSGSGWLPIGQSGFSSRFKGSYNGDGYNITGLYINRVAAGPDVGLFGYIHTDAILTNINLIDVEIIGNSPVGGLLGSNNNGTVSNSFVSGSVAGGTNVGGLVGLNNGSNALVTNSHATASFSGTNSGGLVGHNAASATVRLSYATGSSGSGDGGLVGRNAAGSSIMNSYATGSASGGLAGYNGGSIEDCFAIGIAGSGGLVADDDLGTVTNSYWDTETSGQPTSDGGTGLTTAQMKVESNFSGWDFSTTWSISEGFSFPFLQSSTHRIVGVQISGNEGWRMMGSPLQDATFGTLLDEFWTQGYNGSDFHIAPGNVYTWTQSTHVWTGPSNASNVPVDGQGFIFYVYNDQDNDGTGEGFPKTFLHEGYERGAPVSAGVSYTDTGSPADDGWNLVANPFASSIDWDAVSGWTKTNLDASIYIWNDAASAYQSWNGITGTLPNDGLIAPWQGFWVKANASGPALDMTDNVKSTGGAFYKREAIPEIKFKLSIKDTLKRSDATSQAVIMFSDRASAGKDNLDTWKLKPLGGQNISLFTTSQGYALDVNAQPASITQPITIPLDFENEKEEETLTLSWSSQNLPQGWVVILEDHQTGIHRNIRQDGYLKILITDAKKQSVNNKAKEKITLPGLPTPRLKRAKKSAARFSIRIIPENNTGNNKLPGVTELGQNYPNPFNPTTIIRYGLPASENVTISVYNMLGQKVAILVNNEQKIAGFHTVSFDGSFLASGLYFYRLETPSFSKIQKMMLVK